jgi:hypothetical protein
MATTTCDTSRTALAKEITMDCASIRISTGGVRAGTSGGTR